MTYDRFGNPAEPGSPESLDNTRRLLQIMVDRNDDMSETARRLIDFFDWCERSMLELARMREAIGK